jgi:DNA polymerase III sliding clamp (beta) subunit (PCNA family)
VVVDRLVIRDDITRRLTDSVEVASALAGGTVIVNIVGNDEDIMFSQNYACEDCGISIEELSPRIFSFNNPFGACPTCTGLGSQLKVDPDLIIPNKTVNELIRLLDSDEDAKMKVYVTHRHTIFHLEDMIFFSRVVDGYYIDYEKVLAKEHKIFIKCNKFELLSALERACLITEERIIGAVRANVKLDISDGVLKILANSSAGSTYDEIEIEHEGDNLFIAFNNKYLIDCITACGGDNVNISLTSEHSSINVTPVEKDETVDEEYMLLPVRMNN